MELMRLREQVIQVQSALLEQTQRSQQLVEELTKRLQEKDALHLYEKNLRNDQLAKILKALIHMETRLKREQKSISQQLYRKDLLILKQREEMKKILSGQFCNNCSLVFDPGLHLESSDCIINDPHSSLGPFVTSDQLYTTLLNEDPHSNKSFFTNQSSSEKILPHVSTVEFLHKKKIHNESLQSKLKETLRRGYFETHLGVVTHRSNNTSPFSIEQNTSNDYYKFDSLPTESLEDQFGVKCQDIQKSYCQSQLEKDNNQHNIDATINSSSSDSNITMIHNIPPSNLGSYAELDGNKENLYNFEDSNENCSENELSEESNDKWYVSASDQEEEQQKNTYRNNPVLECVNQILLQNIDTEYDSLRSDQVSPKVEKSKNIKCGSRIFLVTKEQYLSEQNLKENYDYYETPICKEPNFYETPQSLYSNNYEQIRSKYNVNHSKISPEKYDQEIYKKNISHVLKNSKFLGAPPTLPPKPANLVSKCKIQINSLKFSSGNINEGISLEADPDYCSISELNLPSKRLMTSKNFQILTEINAPLSTEIKYIDEPFLPSVANSKSNHYDIVNTENGDMMTKNTVKLHIQNSNRTTISTKDLKVNKHCCTSLCKIIPKLPSVSEIIIPEDTNDEEKNIYQCNYEKNYSEITKTLTSPSRKKSIKIGSSVSSLIMGFNNRELVYGINKKSVKTSKQNNIFTNLQNVHNLSRKLTNFIDSESNNGDFNFVQNFEEFKLDDCECEEYIVNTTESKEQVSKSDIKSKEQEFDINTSRNKKVLKIVAEEVADIDSSSKKFMKKLQRYNGKAKQSMKNTDIYDWKNELTYEHFLECTGLSSKSVLTPSKMTKNYKRVLKSEDERNSSEIAAAMDKCNATSVWYWTEPFIY